MFNWLTIYIYDIFMNVASESSQAKSALPSDSTSTDSQLTRYDDVDEGFAAAVAAVHSFSIN